MKCGNYLWNRNGILYFRMRIPTALLAYMPGKEIRCSLKGMDLQTALGKSTLLGAELNKLFLQALNGMVNMVILHPLARQICSNILFFDGQTQLRLRRENHAPEEYDEVIKRTQKLIRGGSIRTSLSQTLVEYASKRGVGIDLHDSANEGLVLDFYKAYIEVLRIQQERERGNFENGYDAPTSNGYSSKILSPEDISPDLLEAEGFDEEEIQSMRPRPDSGKTWPNLLHQPKQPAPAPIPAPPPCKVTLAQAIEEYVSEKLTCGKWSPKLATMQRGILGILIEYFGVDKDIAQISRREITGLYNGVIKKYPWNRNKLYPGKSLDEIMELSPKPIEQSTAKNYIGYISTFFMWCMDECDYIAKNPAKGFGDAPRERADELKPPFTMEELQTIFREIAAMPERPYFSSKMYPARYWVPLMGLFQGMRLNEICQLFLDNIFAVNGVPCIEITTNEERKQRVKNKYSRRTIPIHSALLKLGFLDYHYALWSMKRRRNDQLFPMLTASDEGYLRKMNSFNDLIHELVPDRRKTLHSLRHNFDTALMNHPEANEFLIACLDGHERQGTLAGRYAVGRIPNMKNMLEKLDYGFDIFQCMDKKPLDEATIQAQIARLPVREF